MEQSFLPVPERHDLGLVIGCAVFLQPVDFTLNGGAFPVVAQALERPNAIERFAGRVRLTAYLLDKPGLYPV
jgi:hypothetical protein